MNKIFYLMLVLLLFHLSIYSQNESKEEKYKTLALMSLFSEGLNERNVVINGNNLTKFLKTNIVISEIAQDDFENIVFLHIEQGEINPEQEEDASLPTIWGSSSCNGYIVAVTKGNYVFKLKGFKINEFHPFLRYLNEKPNNRNKRKFIKNYKVKGLDFECLFESLKSNKSGKDLEKMLCISDTCLKIMWTH